MNTFHVNRRTLAKSAAFSTALMLTGARVAPARAASDVTLRLPPPTGRHRVGITPLHLVDHSRRDPWDPTIPVRELMISVLYPARATAGHPLAPQMTAGAAALFGEIMPFVHPQLPTAGVDWAATMTHSYTDAPAQAVRHPVVFYSPGGGDPRTLGTTVAEELASRGFVVVTIDHPGDAVAVEFPSATSYRGKVRSTVFTADPRTDPVIFRTMIDTRIADCRFVLDQLEVLASGGNPDAAHRTLPQDLHRALDPRRIGIYGHSAGGTTVAETMYEDCRIRAAINLEGYLDYAPDAAGAGKLLPVARNGSDRPLLMLGTDGFTDHAGLERSWSAVLSRSHGLAIQRQLDHAAHWVFTDYDTFAQQLEAAGLMTAAGRISLVGAAGSATSVPLVRDTVYSFLAEYLRERTQ